MIAEITAWLQSPKYWDGVRLYEKFGESQFLKSLFHASEDDYNRGKLVEELERINSEAVQVEQRVVESMPADLVDQLEKARRLMDERSAIKERIRTFYLDGKVEDAIRPLAFEILRINDRLLTIYDNERFFRQTGHMPDAQSLSEETIPQLITRRNTLRTYISREKKDHKRVEFQNEMFAVVKKLEALGVNSKETDEENYRH